MLSGHASVRPCARTSWKLQREPSGTPSRLRHFPLHGCHLRHQPGAEQGDVLGTIQRTMVLGQARDVCDEWFVDDGQVFGGAARTATSRGPRACFVLQSASRSTRVGTRRTCTTPSTSSLRSQAPRRWGQPSAPVSTSTHERESQCEPVTSCAPPLAALIMVPQ